ncbi:helix-turn-helix domain-containing protein [Paludibacterium denitrificans]|uniref:HTH cro/C1-type domain-containing protein n=1 Tax=Paludibacterium denitrificans TaxID=2675226 RepID=A0A844GBM6_9NEIS|nr:helix-turn-helix transcriptional regulator [Paludibacterium denitrificans]MTD33916.1 hypothetical protein [Paludibacterium denitrificans]
MEKSVDYLKAAIEKLGAKSDTKAAQSLEISKQAISQYLNESRVMDDFAAAKVAEALGIHPWEVITLCNAEREKTEERRAFWRGFRSGAAGIQAQAGCATVKGMAATALSAPALIFVVNAARELWRLC